jgi:hypothetical protein
MQGPRVSNNLPEQRGFLPVLESPGQIISWAEQELGNFLGPTTQDFAQSLLEQQGTDEEIRKNLQVI